MKPEDELIKALREFTNLPVADRRAIMQLLPERERKLVQHARRHGSTEALRKQDQQKALAGFSPALSGHLRRLLDPRRPEKAKITPAARAALASLMGIPARHGP